jgi:hypothetical protein
MSELNDWHLTNQGQFLKGMICPSCKRESLPFWRLVVRLLYPLRFTCSDCGTNSKVKLPWIIQLLLVCLGCMLYVLLSRLSTSLGYMLGAILFAIFVAAFLEAQFGKAVLLNKERKYVFSAIQVIYFICISWAIFVIVHDETPDPGIREFFDGKHIVIADNEDAGVAIDGINAPPGENIVARGVRIRSLYPISDGVEWKSLTTSPGLLTFSTQNDELNCWVWVDTSSKAACASPERVNNLLAENKYLLDRYWRITKLPKFGRMHINGQLVINLNKLIAAGLLLKTQNGRSELAYQDWKNNFNFLVNGISSENTVIDKAILLVAYRIAIANLESLLYAAPALVDRHGSELHQLLRPGGMARFNPEGELRAEYFSFDPIFSSDESKLFWHHENFLRNTYYRFTKAYLSGLQHKSMAEIEASISVVKKRYMTLLGFNADLIEDPLNSAISVLMTTGQAKTIEVIKALLADDEQLRLIDFRVSIQLNHLKDKDIPDFLTKSSQGLGNLYKNQPVHFDANRHVLWIGGPNCESNIQAARLPSGKWPECIIDPAK